MKYISLISILALLPQVGWSDFLSPIQLSSAQGAIQTEKPGYASPCIADIDGDGKDELLVGQFFRGNVAIYEINDLTAKTEQVGEKRWLLNGKDRAKVPGVY